MALATKAPCVSKALFTVEEAERALPLVRAIVADLVAEFRGLRLAGRERRAAEQEAARRGGPAPADLPLAERVRELSDHVESYLRELAALGLEVRDLELGLVDFPTLLGSEPAFLCWKLGEPHVAFWHAADRGHAERLPLAGAPARLG